MIFPGTLTLLSPDGDPTPPLPPAPPAPGTGLEGLSADHKGHPSAVKFKDVNGLFGSYLEAEKQLGASIVIPGKDDGQEAWDTKLHSKIGWPEKVEGYTRLNKNEVPDGMTYNEGFENKYYNIAHKLRMNGKQANGMLQELNTIQLELQKTADTENTAAVEQAKKDMLVEFGSQEASNKAQEIAARFIGHFGGADMVKFVDESGLGSNLMFMKFMNKVGGNWVEDTAITGGRTPGGDHTQNQDQIEKAIKEKQEDPRYKAGDQDFIMKELMPLYAQKKPIVKKTL